MCGADLRLTMSIDSDQSVSELLCEEFAPSGSSACQDLASGVLTVELIVWCSDVYWFWGLLEGTLLLINVRCCL